MRHLCNYVRVSLMLHPVTKIPLVVSPRLRSFEGGAERVQSQPLTPCLPMLKWDLYLTMPITLSSQQTKRLPSSKFAPARVPESPSLKSGAPGDSLMSVCSYSRTRLGKYVGSTSQGESSPCHSASANGFTIFNGAAMSQRFQSLPAGSS